MSDTRLNIRIDSALKEEAKEIFQELGMDLTTAVTVFLKQSVRDRSLPFQPHLDNPDNIQTRKEVEKGNMETFNTVEDWWEDLNAED